MPQMIEAARAAGETLLPAIKRVVATADALKTWRLEAGPKSKWSNHTRLKETGIYNAFAKEAENLGELLVRLMPEHWQMQDWGIRGGRMGRLRWANKKGRGRDGCSIQTSERSLSAAIGMLAGLALGPREANASDLAHFEAVGISLGEPLQISLAKPDWPYHWPTISKGCSPADARAHMLTRGKELHFPTPMSISSIKKAYETGYQDACRTLKRKQHWGAYPTLMSRLYKDRRTRRLMRSLPELGSDFGPRNQGDLLAFDRDIAAALALLEKISSKPPSEKQTFLIRCDDGQLVGVEGWCAPSAALNLLLSRVFLDQPVGDMGMWHIYALADERGAEVRAIGDHVFASTPETAAP